MKRRINEINIAKARTVFRKGRGRKKVNYGKQMTKPDFKFLIIVRN